MIGSPSHINNGRARLSKIKRISGACAAYADGRRAVDQEITRVHPADRLAKGHGELRCLPVSWAVKASIIRENGLSDNFLSGVNGCIDADFFDAPLNCKK